MAEAASWVPQGSVLGPILYVIYANGLSDNPTIDHLLYADVVKLIAPRKQSDTLQSSLLASSKWSEDWALSVKSSKSEHLPVGDTPKPVAYSLPSRTSPDAQPIQAVSSVRDLGLLLYTGLSTDDNVARAPKKARGMLFYLKRSFALYKAFISPHLEYAIQASSPILSRDWQALERVQKLVVKFVKGLRHVPYETALQRLQLPEDIMTATPLETFKFRLDAKWQSLFPEVPL